MGECAKCFHSVENHKPIDGAKASDFISHICTGALDCRCEHFEEQYLEAFAVEIAMHKQKRWTQFDKAKYILEKIPQTRNAGEKTFAKIYNEIWFGFKIRKDGTKLTIQEWRRMPHDDTINRAKRRVKHNHPELGTYNPKVLYEQTALFQALMEMAIE